MPSLLLIASPPLRPLLTAHMCAVLCVCRHAVHWCRGGPESKTNQSRIDSSEKKGLMSLLTNPTPL